MSMLSERKKKRAIRAGIRVDAYDKQSLDGDRGINNATSPMIFSVFAATTTRPSERTTSERPTDLPTDRSTGSPVFTQSRVNRDSE